MAADAVASHVINSSADRVLIVYNNYVFVIYEVTFHIPELSQSATLNVDTFNFSQINLTNKDLIRARIFCDMNLSSINSWMHAW